MELKEGVRGEGAKKSGAVVEWRLGRGVGRGGGRERAKKSGAVVEMEG